MESKELLIEKYNEDEEIIKTEKIEYTYNEIIYDLILILTKTQILFKCREKNISIINKNNKNNNHILMNEQYFNKISNIKCYNGQFQLKNW